MGDDNIDYETYKKKQIEADEFKNELNQWIIKRKQLNDLLLFIANECDTHQKNCDIAEVTGSTTAAVGGLGILGASIFTLLTGGAAAPLLVGAAATAATLGTATTVGTKITHAIIDSNKQDEIDKLLKEDREMIKNIEKRCNDMKSSSSYLLIGCTLLGLSYPTFKFLLWESSLTNASEMVILKTGRVSFNKNKKYWQDIRSAIDSIMTSITKVGEFLTEMMLNQIYCTVLAIASTALVVVSILQVVNSSVSIHNGSKSEIGNKVRKLVDGFKDQLKHAEELDKAVRDHKAVEDVETLKETLKDVLNVITERGTEVTESEYSLIAVLIKDWLNWLKEQTLSNYDEKSIINCFINLYRDTKEKTESKNQGDHLTFVILAHGQIFNQSTPSSVYYGYFNLSKVKSVRLYVPWGTDLDATAAASILRGTVSQQNMKYLSSTFFGSKDADIYDANGNIDNGGIYFFNEFNILPNNSSVILPYIQLTATYVNEPVISATQRYLGENPQYPDRIIIQYFNDESKWILYPDVPSFVVNTLLSLLCWFMGFTCQIESVHCLGLADLGGYSKDIAIPARQYFSTKPCDSVYMIDSSVDDKSNRELLNALDKMLKK